ncbi:MAG: tyrosine-type recombinase/integrase, partial [Planctomycetota bacterium]
MKVAALVERYLAWKADRVCPGTLRGYTQHVAWFEDVFGERDWGGLGRLDVLNALEASFRTAGGRKLAAATRNHRRNAFADLQRFAAKRVEPPLAAKLTPEDLQRETSASRQRFPTPAEFWRLLDAARPDARPVFQFLAFTGCRPDEACRARIQDIADRHDGRAIVLREHKTAAKTGAPRLIPIGGTHVFPLVAAAVGDRTTGPVFLTRLRRPWSRDNLSTLWRRARSAAGLGDDLV